MKSIASKMAGPGGPSSYISHISTQLYMHCNFGLGRLTLYSAGWGKNKNARNQVIFSVLRWKFGLLSDPPGSRDLKCSEISMECHEIYNLLI